MWTGERRDRMLTTDERREIENEFRHYVTKRAVAVDALRIVQRRRRWISDQAMEDVAALLEMTPAELGSIATAYSLIFRRPVGRHVILLCDSVSCHILGYQSLQAYLERKLGIGLGQTTLDDRFTLLPVACLGACDEAPAIMVDEDLHGHLTPQKLDGILAKYE
jgi:NADH-quinone oxidoreductase subunit E